MRFSERFKISVVTMRVDENGWTICVTVWFLCPHTLHKLGYHRADVIKEGILPIGHISEEGREFRNKHTRISVFD